MTGLEPGRRVPTATSVLLGALLAGTMLYLVPTLALNGQLVPALFAGLVGVGIGALWILQRRALRDTDLEVATERRAQALHRSLLEHGTEAHIVLDADGAISFVSESARSVLGLDPEQLRDSRRLLDLVPGRDRRRALHAFASVRRQPGASFAVELAGLNPDGSDCFLDVRVVNLADTAAVDGILVTVRDITPRKTFESEIQHLAYYDALTGLANRRFFLEQGTKALALARRHDEPAAVLYLDLDRFNHVNDRLGYDRGDALLEQVARGLQRSLRDTDVVARLGGDEFAVVLGDVGDEESAGRVARRILANLPALGEGDRDEPVRASLGLAMFPDDAEDLEALLKAADTAMYRAKAEDGGVQFYRPELRTSLAEQIRLEQDLKRGLERHEFHLHYQPVFHLMTGQMVGAEALSRWRHFARGMVTASEFIALAERTGMIRSLDRWAIARAVHQRSGQLGGGWAGWVGWVAVNLSPHSFADPGLPGYIGELLERAGLEPGSLVLELPEKAVVRSPSSAADLMWELKNTGAAIALDDFGMNPTSFSRLKRLPIDILKLHPQFVTGIGEDDGDEQLVEAAIAIAHGIRARVLAKGVERDDQVDWLRDAGCDFVQGYLMGPPVPAADLGERQEAERQG